MYKVQSSVQVNPVTLWWTRLVSLGNTTAPKTASNNSLVRGNDTVQVHFYAKASLNTKCIPCVSLDSLSVRSRVFCLHNCADFYLSDQIMFANVPERTLMEIKLITNKWVCSIQQAMIDRYKTIYISIYR